jgi:hypothetical protein
MCILCQKMWKIANELGIQPPPGALHDEDQKDVPQGFGYESYPFASTASPPTCLKNCRECAAQYRPLAQQGSESLKYAKAYSDQDAAKILSGLVQSSRDDLDYVRQQLETYGDTIAKRWSKRSPDKRAALLKMAKPNIFKRRWLPMDLSATSSPGNRGKTSVDITVSGSCLASTCRL